MPFPPALRLIHLFTNRRVLASLFFVTFITTCTRTSLAQDCFHKKLFRSIRPSTCLDDNSSSSNKYIPPTVTIINRGVYSTDEPHLVIAPFSPSSSFVAGDVLNGTKNNIRNGNRNKYKNSINNEKKKSKDPAILRVFLPGTTSTPMSLSCLLASIGRHHHSSSVRLEASESLQPVPQQHPPIIGLSYTFLNASDAGRNKVCRNRYYSSNDKYWNCLEQQHLDAIYGGSGKGEKKDDDSDSGEEKKGLGLLWQPVSYEDSIIGRLTALLQLLSQTYPDEGWDAYLTTTSAPSLSMLMTTSSSSSFPFRRIKQQPNWNRIWMMGHSQGAGHAAYLAQTVHLAGVGLLSGPQDDCGETVYNRRRHRHIIHPDKGGNDTIKRKGGSCWVQRRFATPSRNIRAFAQIEESAVGTIRNNWNIMPPFQNVAPFELTHDAIIGNSDAGTISTTTKVLVLPVSVFKHNRPLITIEEPQYNASCTRANHCSTSKDYNSPLANTTIAKNNGATNNEIQTSTEKHYLYAPFIWPYIAGEFDNDIALDEDNMEEESSNRFILEKEKSIIIEEKKQNNSTDAFVIAHQKKHFVQGIVLLLLLTVILIGTLLQKSNKNRNDYTSIDDDNDYNHLRLQEKYW